MRRLHIIIWVCAVFHLASAQKVLRSYIPHGALFYNSRWQPVPSADKASYYRVSPKTQLQVYPLKHTIS